MFCLPAQIIRLSSAAAAAADAAADNAADAAAVMAELEELGSRYPFRIPPFFALILRAFSVIEGIALAVDPDYAIVQVGVVSLRPAFFCRCCLTSCKAWVWHACWSCVCLHAVCCWFDGASSFLV
jgi:hypothetical protein